MIPTWLKRRHIGDTSRAVTIRLCPTCRAPVLVGLDADHLALKATCDPTPLSALGEAVALVTGRTTYTLTPGKDRKELDYRDEWRIANPTRNPILAAHQCHGISLAPFAAPPAQKKADDANDQIPY